MTPTTDELLDRLRPFEAAAGQYRRAGWLGTLPLPRRRKDPVPQGFTGKRFYDIDPDSTDVEQWIARQGDGNIALRMPRDVIGVDVDAYGEKAGAATLEEAEEKWGELPPTWISTSRSDGVSGIRFFRAAEGLAWPSVVGPGIEMVHRGHRYAVVWPSIHPDTERLYQWIGPDGFPSQPPRPSELPELPDEWVLGLTGGALAGDATPRADIDGSTTRRLVKGWATEGILCAQVEAKLEAGLESLHSSAGGRHDATRDLSLAILYYGQQGHSGVEAAMQMLERTFVEQVGKDRGHAAAMAEFERFVLGAAEIIAARPRPAEQCYGVDCDRKLRPVPGLPEITPRTRPQDAPGGSLTASGAEDAFWDARPELSHVRAFSRARRASPWAVLGCVLVRVTCAIGPAIVLPPLRGGEASLNLFVGVVGPSGSGKGAAEACAREAFRFGPQVEAGLGSGEGLVKSFIEWVPPKKGDPEPGHYNLHTTSVLFRASEVDTLAALKGRSGSTLLPLLRDAWSGDTLGFAYAAAEKRVNLPAHAYRLGLVVGIQPNRAQAILEESDGGTPQRFLWLPAIDPMAPDVAPECPDPWTTWQMPQARHLKRAMGTGRSHLEVCEAARREVDENHLRQTRGDIGALDGHALLARLKVAAALGALAGRLGIDDEDWLLAGVVMAKSDATRAEVQRSLSAVAQETVKTRAWAEAEKQVQVAERLEEASTKRIARRALSKLSATDWTTAGALRKFFKAAERADLEPALEQLVASGLVDVEEYNYQGAQTCRYRLSGGAR